MKNTLPTRNADGSLPCYAWPGGYPILYLDKHNDTLCAECATKDSDNGEEPAAHFVHYEGPSEFCAECNAEVESAYGDLEEETEEPATVPLQGVCKDCGHGTLNNNLSPAFEEWQGVIACIDCHSTHVDIL